MDINTPNVLAPNGLATNVEAPNVLAPTITAPKKAIVRKTIPKKYLDYLKFAFVAMNTGGTFSEIVKLKEPVDNIINHVKAIIDNEETGERINEIRKELLKKPREKKAVGPLKASSKKRKTDGEAGEALDPDTTLVNSLVDGLTAASEPKTPRKKAKSANTGLVADTGTAAGDETPPATPTVKEVPKTPRKKATKPSVDPSVLAPVATDLTNDLTSVANA
jgi:hypothetical protein